MSPFFAVPLGGLAGLAVGGFLTNPVVGPNWFVSPADRDAPQGTEGTGCGTGLLGDAGGCVPPLVCGPGFLQGTCVKPNYARNVVLLTAVCTLTGAAAGYLLSRSE